VSRWPERIHNTSTARELSRTHTHNNHSFVLSLAPLAINVDQTIFTSDDSSQLNKVKPFEMSQAMIKAPFVQSEVYAYRGEARSKAGAKAPPPPPDDGV